MDAPREKHHDHNAKRERCVKVENRPATKDTYIRNLWSSIKADLEARKFSPVFAPELIK